MRPRGELRHAPGASSRCHQRAPLLAQSDRAVWSRCSARIQKHVWRRWRRGRPSAADAAAQRAGRNSRSWFVAIVGTQMVSLSRGSFSLLAHVAAVQRLSLHVASTQRVNGTQRNPIARRIGAAARHGNGMLILHSVCVVLCLPHLWLHSQSHEFTVRWYTGLRYTGLRVMLA